MRPRDEVYSGPPGALRAVISEKSTKRFRLTMPGSSGKLVLCHCPGVLRLAGATPTPCTRGAPEVHTRCTRDAQEAAACASLAHLLCTSCTRREARENRPGPRLSARPAFQLPPPPEPSFPGIFIPCIGDHWKALSPHNMLTRFEQRQTLVHALFFTRTLASDRRIPAAGSPCVCAAPGAGEKTNTREQPHVNGFYHFSNPTTQVAPHHAAHFVLGLCASDFVPNYCSKATCARPAQTNQPSSPETEDHKASADTGIDSRKSLMVISRVLLMASAGLASEPKRSIRT
jgi:hypothetical protein